MSGAPTLIQWMTLLICLTTLLTTTQGRQSYLEHRDRLLYIFENDACRDMFHIIPHGKQQCEEALYHFLTMEKEYQTDCPGARDPECQIIDRESTCTFTCDPTLMETYAASQDGRTATVRTKTLRAVTITLRNYLQETEEDKRQRYERLGLRLQLQEVTAQDRNAREWQKRQERRQQFMEQMQVLRLQGQQPHQYQQQPVQSQQQLELRQQRLEQRRQQERLRREERRRKFMEDRQRLFTSRLQGQQPAQHQPQPEQHQQQSQQELQQHQWRQLPQHQVQQHQPQLPQWQQQGQQQQLQLGGNAEARLRRRRRMDIVKEKRSQHPRLQE